MAERPRERVEDVDRSPRVLLRLFAEYAHQHPWLVALSVCSMVLMSVQDVVLPHFTGRMVNAIKGGTRGRSSPELVRALVWVMALSTALQVAYVGADFVDARLMPSLQSFFRHTMLGCILERNRHATAEELYYGDIISRFAKMPLTITLWFDSLKSMLPHLVVYAVASAYLARIDLALGLAFLAVVAVVMASLWASVGSCGPVSARRDNQLHTIQESVDETLRNLPAIYMTGREGDEHERIAEQERAYDRLYSRTLTCALWMKVWTVPAVLSILAAVLLRCKARIAAGTLSTGTFVSLMIVTLFVTNSLMRITSYTRSLVFQWGIIQSSLHLVDKCDAGTSGGAGLPAPADPSRRSSFGSVGVTYGRGRTDGGGILQNVTLDIGFGEKVALVGPIGSGKTTFLRLLTRLVEPSRGTMHFRGVPYARVDASDFLREIAYVPQNAVLFDRSVLDNIRYGGDGTLREAEVWAMIDALGIRQEFDGLGEEGLRTTAGKGGSRLSGGQRQMVWLLRALARRPTVLVLDEPTASLDPGSRTAVVRILARLPITVVVATHDMDLVAGVADRVVAFGKQGRIVSDSNKSG